MIVAASTGTTIGVAIAVAAALGWFFRISGILGWVERRAAMRPSIPPGGPPPLAPGTSAGWYADPYNRATWRWWDGRRWTDETS